MITDSKNLLKMFIVESLNEISRIKVIDYEAIDKQRKDDKEAETAEFGKIKRPQYMPPGKDIKHSSDIEQSDLEEKIFQVMGDEEMQSVEAYVDWAFENDVDTFDVIALQAIARNMSKQMAPGQLVVKKIREELLSYGLKRIERQSIDRSRRGHSSPIHGRSPYADFGGGGTGLSDGGIGLGAGPGVMGSKTNWDPNDPKSLRMGTYKK